MDWVFMIPIQYSNISETKKQLKELNQSQNELNENMSFEEQELQYNLQGSLFNIPSNIVAAIIYKICHLQEGK